MKRKNTQAILTFARPGLKSIFMVTVDVVSGFHLQHLNSLYAVYSLHICSHDECLANDWICASAFNLFAYLHYVLSQGILFLFSSSSYVIPPSLSSIDSAYLNVTSCFQTETKDRKRNGGRRQKTIRKILKSLLELCQSSAIVTGIKLRQIRSELAHSPTVTRIVAKQG